MSLLTVRTTSSANVIPRACRVWAVSYLGTATVGTITLSDPTTPTGTGGTTRAVLDTAQGSTFAGMIPLDGGLGASGGISFNTGCAVALSGVTACTLQYTNEGV